MKIPVSHDFGCLICGIDLVYREYKQQSVCALCENELTSDVECSNGHYVCDRCHDLPAIELIEQTCSSSSEIDPMKLVDSLMKHPAIKMHGPEHHFLVPAVLITTYYKVRGENPQAEKLAIARKRAEDVKGGFCGFHGTCGAAMGAGIACSILTGSTPLAKDGWRLSNLMTAECLTAIGEAGGPRCCKRNTYLALLVGRDFLIAHLKANLPTGHIPVCSFSANNKECIESDCLFSRSNRIVAQWAI